MNMKGDAMKKTTKAMATKAGRRGKPPLTIKISGPAGSGKTVVAAIVIDALRAAGWSGKALITDEPKVFDTKDPRSFVEEFRWSHPGWHPAPQTVRVESRGDLPAGCGGRR